MSGLRVGYLAAKDPVFLERVKKLLRCSINGVNSIAQWGAAAALDAPTDASRAMSAEYQLRRDRMLAGLEGLPFQPIRPSGSFFLWTRIDPAWPGHGGRADDEAMTEFLIDRGGVGSAPGTAFGPAGAGCLRFAFSCATSDVDAAVAELRGIFGKA